MPTSAPGSSARIASHRPRGFTLIEVMVVLAIVAVAAGLISLALRDPAETRLEQEAARLVALLETARAEARSSGLTAAWVPADETAGRGFRFIGLPSGLALPNRWLDERVVAQVVGAPGLTLGPDAILPPQRVVLRLDDRRLEIGSDGLGAFAVLAGDGPPGGAAP